MKPVRLLKIDGRLKGTGFIRTTLPGYPPLVSAKHEGNLIYFSITEDSNGDYTQRIWFDMDLGVPYPVENVKWVE